MHEVEHVVVGAGVMGSSTARWLARSGRDVLLLEQFDVGHVRGSSHGLARIFRLSYPDTVYVEMAKEALPLWRDLESQSGVELLRRTGGVDLGRTVEPNAAAMRAAGVDCEVIDGAEAKRRFPSLAVPDDHPVLFHPDAGITNAEATVRANVELARSHGAKVEEHVRCLELRLSDGGAEVVSDDGTVAARTAVVTAGAWAKGLLATAGIDIDVRPTRQTVCYFDIDVPPPTLVEWEEEAMYGLPSPGQGLKAGEHVSRDTIDPDEAGTGDQESVERIRAWVSKRYTGVDTRPHLVETCLYTNTPDESFILERHGPIVVGSPCSGHGFKFSPLIGKRLADLATA